jgi:hypothetical protein
VPCTAATTGALARARCSKPAGSDHAAQVSAETEILALAPQQHGAYAGVFADGMSGRGELASELQIHGIRRICAHQGEMRHMLANFQAYHG